MKVKLALTVFFALHCFFLGSKLVEHILWLKVFRTQTNVLENHMQSMHTSSKSAKSFAHASGSNSALNYHLLAAMPGTKCELHASGHLEFCIYLCMNSAHDISHETLTFVIRLSCASHLHAWPLPRFVHHICQVWSIVDFFHCVSSTPLVLAALQT